MHLACVLIVAFFYLCCPARAYQDCAGRPHVKVFWGKEVIQVDDAFFQMSKQKLGKKAVRLVGHEMVFVRQKSTNTLIRDGAVTRYAECEEVEGENSGLKKTNIAAYVPNKIVEAPASDDPPAAHESGSHSTHNGGGRGPGHGGGGHGGGGHGGGGGRR